TLETHAADGDDVAQHLDAKLSQKCFGERADGDAGSGLSRAGAFKDIAGIGEVVLDGAGEVSVSGTGARNGLFLVLGAVNSLDGEDSRPVLPFLVADDQSDGRADGLGVADSGHNFHGIGLDLHPAAAAIALLAPPKFVIDSLNGNRNSSGESDER